MNLSKFWMALALDTEPGLYRKDATEYRIRGRMLAATALFSGSIFFVCYHDMIAVNGNATPPF